MCSVGRNHLKVALAVDLAVPEPTARAARRRVPAETRAAQLLKHLPARRPVARRVAAIFQLIVAQRVAGAVPRGAAPVLVAEVWQEDSALGGGPGALVARAVGLVDLVVAVGVGRDLGREAGRLRRQAEAEGRETIRLCMLGIAKSR
ncbi:hypothetical protein PG991_001191 [Apiospora marii]|uniref:Uncharacterized protein n=1 Tax=Apiospora marii TaxID=335849 RepID=A0ABR1SU40_9PEZI